MKLLPTLLLALTVSISLTHAADAPKQRPGAGGAAAGPMLQKFDANKNGVLDPNEKETMMKAIQERKGGGPKGGAPGPKGGAPGAKGGPAKGGGQIQEMLLQKFDANKNGVLDPEEKEAAKKAMQERRGKAGGAPGTGAPAPGGTNSEGGSKFRRPPEAPKEK